MVAHLGLHIYELLNEEIGNIIAEIYQSERKQIKEIANASVPIFGAHIMNWATI